LDHIFEPFFTTKGGSQGTGMGLATVYGIVKQSDGHIVTESRPGIGTTFNIYLPQVEGKLEATAEKPEPAVTLAGDETILLAEDEPALREVLHLQLEDSGYNVLDAHNAAEALEVAHKHSGSIDLLLTDVLMSGRLNGFELAAELKSMWPDLKVIYMTGYTADAIDAKGFADLQNSILQKPFTTDALLRKLRDVLDSEEQSQQSVLGSQKN
jgi:CheY-like chemotaxis protein